MNAALAANDRLKYSFSILQMALAHADHPEQPASTLRRERLAAGIDDPRLDDTVATAQRDGDRYRAPGSAKVPAGLKIPVSAVQLRPPAPALFHRICERSVEGQRCGEFCADYRRSDRAFAEAPIRLRERLKVPRSAGVPIEPRGILALTPP
ncbi:MAG TPA: hypothetical protein VEW91_07370 [bacterium]|nr:hypothetical protein [bacterium]